MAAVEETDEVQAKYTLDHVSLNLFCRLYNDLTRMEQIHCMATRQRRLQDLLVINRTPPVTDLSTTDSTDLDSCSLTELEKTKWLNGTVKLLDVGPAHRMLMSAGECCSWYKAHTRYLRAANIISGNASARSPATPASVAIAGSVGNKTVSLQSAEVSVMSAELDLTPRQKRVRKRLFPADAAISITDLEVRESRQQSQVFADARRAPGLGVFLPENMSGYTARLTFCGEGVECRKEALVEDWQHEYKILNRNRPGFWFVPATKDIRCVLFRVQHSDERPSHYLYQSEEDEYVHLVCLRSLLPGEELTFEYGIAYMESLHVSQSQSSTDDGSITLSGSSYGGTPRAGGGVGSGHQRYWKFVGKLSAKASDYDRLDVRPDLGF